MKQKLGQDRVAHFDRLIEAGKKVQIKNSQLRQQREQSEIVGLTFKPLTNHNKKELELLKKQQLVQSLKNNNNNNTNTQRVMT